MDPARVVIAGGGGTGGALAHDLALAENRILRRIAPTGAGH